MEGRGGCCIARYAGGAHDMSKVDRIMLRFRPIAPKPDVGGSDIGGSKPEKTMFVRGGRTKRRYVRDYNKNNNNNNNKRCNRRKRVFSEEKNSSRVVTLPLLPETPDRKENPARVLLSDLDLAATARYNPGRKVPIWLNFSNPESNPGGNGKPDRTVLMPQPVKPVGSCVMVECVTETCVEGEGLGCTDDERRNNLDMDTCPGFISDGLNWVKWTNKAYRRMVEEGEGDERPEMVWLVMKEKIPVNCRTFVCRVRLQYTCRNERNSLTVPCDVWGMDNGGFAWRLDVKAALSLGR